jgi:Hydrazine synthase alpha subunit middle domain
MRNSMAMTIRLAAALAGAAGMLLQAALLPAQEPLYEKQPTLQQTMLVTRARLQQWQAAQKDARGAVKVSAWQRVKLGGNETLDPVAATSRGLDSQQTRFHWTKCASDAAGNVVLASNSTDNYLCTTITATKPVMLTLELSRHERFGGFAYRPPPSGAGVKPSDALVWVNGKPVTLHDRLAGYERVPVAKRRGWHDAVLVDVPLEAGENRLLVALDKHAQRSWFNAVRVSSAPEPALWAMIQNDFPPEQHRLLEQVDFKWFEPGKGWFAQHAEPSLEKQFVDGAIESLGADAAAIRARYDMPARASSTEALDLCAAVAGMRASLRDMDALIAAVKELRDAFPDRYPGERLLERATELRRRLLAKVGAPDEPLLREIQGLQREALVTKNPLLAGKKLLFVKRHTFDSNHYYDEFNEGSKRFGGALSVLSLADGTVSDIAPQLGDGIFDRYDLSFDARRILFDYKPPKPQGYRVYEIGVDGRGLRQVTQPPEDEETRITAYAGCSREELAKNPGRYGHWSDDMHPCYLPDGGMVFTSTRVERSVLCGGHSLTVPSLHRINADGSGLTLLSHGALSEFCPTVMNDGRILYNRWEYVDKGAGAVQSLWTMFPDGSQSEEVYGNNITTPAVLNQARQVPGRNDLVVCLGSGHSPGNVGAIILVDLHKDKRFEEAMNVLTPGSLPKGNWGLRQFRNGRWIVDIYGPWYCDPFPLTDPASASVAGKFFLVSCNPTGEWNDPAGFGLYLLDVFGNRVPIYRDPAISCFQARPLEPRTVPPALSGASEKVAASKVDAPQADASRSDAATVLVTDVYQGLDGVAPGAVKYLRVMEQVARPWSVYTGYQGNDRAPGQMVAVSLYAHLSIKVLHGIVPVREDGSAFFTVPANRNIFLQTLDKDFMEIQRMRTFVNFQPGERRSCIGCHENRSHSPVSRVPLALKSAPVQPQPQPGETAPRPIHYPTDIQPIFDRHCISCHGAQKPAGDLVLTGEMTELFCKSYEEIIHKDLTGYIQEFIGPKPDGSDAMGYAPAVPPYTYGSHKSKLVSILRAGHHGVTLPREEWIKLVTWVDANTPYYGTYFGRRNIAYRDRPDFRPVPTLESAQGNRPAGP